MATHLRTELVVEVLEMAVEQRRPEAVVHHSDQGCQYTSLAHSRFPGHALTPTGVMAIRCKQFRYVRSYRSNSTRGSVSAWPVSSAPNVRISVAARGPPRDAEQPLEVAAARQQRTVQLLELP